MELCHYLYVDLFGFGFHVSYTSDTAPIFAPLWLLGSAAVAVVAVELTVVTPLTPLVYRIRLRSRVAATRINK